MSEDVTANYHGGNQQSGAAAKVAAQSAPGIRGRIMRLMAAHPDGLTAEQICQQLGIGHENSGRCSDLRRDGYLVEKKHPNGEVVTRRTMRGNAAAVLVANPSGIPGKSRKRRRPNLDVAFVEEVFDELARLNSFLIPVKDGYRLILSVRHGLELKSLNARCQEARKDLLK